jgi:hypothetical protein
VDLTERRIILDRTQKDRHAMIDKSVGHPGHQGQGESPIGIVRQKTDRETAFAEQPTRQRIRPEPNFARNSLYPLPRLVRHAASVVECLRRCRNTDIRSRSHVVDRNSPELSSFCVQPILLNFRLRKPFLIVAVKWEKVFSPQDQNYGRRPAFGDVGPAR